jgi:hypothetical protein
MEIVITLESYNDIFDDFDPRPFNERSLSADFVNILHERIKKVDFSTHMTIILTVPKKQRSENEEKIIEGRLKEHFKNSVESWENKGKEIIETSIKDILVGLAIYVGGGMIDSYIHVLRQYLLIPAWFVTWRAVELLIIDYPKTGAKKQFYRYIGNAMIVFKDDEFYKA